MQVTTVGLDLAKNIFHLHGVTKDREIAFNTPLRRSMVLGFFARLFALRCGRRGLCV